jgi:hypothetical protein
METRKTKLGVERDGHPTVVPAAPTSTSSTTDHTVAQVKDACGVVGVSNQGNIKTSTLIATETSRSNHTAILYPPPSSSRILREGRIEFNIQEPVASFTGRKHVISQLYEALGHRQPAGASSVTSRMKVIAGLPGIGKTQTVRKYIQNYKGSYDHVLWINAESHSEAINCFHRLAELIQIDIHYNGKQKAEEDILDEIYSFVCKKFALIVFDNVESSEVKDVKEGLHLLLPLTLKPGWEVPAIIVTTRNWHWNNSPITDIE